MTTEAPLFDSSRKALVFALNASIVANPPSPIMNREMAAVKLKVKGKTKKERKVLELEEQEQLKMKTQVRFPKLNALEKAVQAGFILQQLARLEKPEQFVLVATLTTPRLPCLCQRDCCSGWRPVPRWVAAIRDLCTVLAQTGEVLKIDGKRGLSTQPLLRQLIVEQYATKHTATLTDMASRAGVSNMTAAKHRDWIVAYLEQIEGQAWQAIDLIFDQTGVTGALG